ncbi:hypothetical protein FJTKL_14671 [Diaporthe vaccinii]|uniref:Uncharacterized protein n=1 Tax=Diaporthe vaccinii TaxID=105482 RepID=A0ABR4F7Z5_9PEZI
MFEEDEDAGSTQQSAQPFAACYRLEDLINAQTFMPQIKNRKSCNRVGNSLRIFQNRYPPSCCNARKEEEVGASE